MKIALVCPYDWAKHGGVRAHVLHLARHLAADHHVRVVAPASGPIEPEREVDVEVVGHPVPVPYNRAVAPVAVTPRAARRTVRALAEFDPHVVHVHEPLSPMVSASAAAFGPHPIVGTFHAWSASQRLYRLSAPLTRRIASRLDVRVAVSPAAQQFAAAALGMPLGAFRVLPNGVDVRTFAGAEPLPGLVDRDRPLLLFVGRLERRKGVDVAIRAFLRLRAARPRVRLVVVGDGPERARCAAMVPPSLRGDVRFAGVVPAADLARYHASADVFVSSAVGGESFGIVLLEAMAAGLPVVASDIPGYRTVMKDGRQGWLVPPGDAFALADALGTLLANERLRKAMAVEGRATAAEYDWSVVGRSLEALYRSARLARP